MSAIIQVRNLTKSFNEIHAVDNLTFTVNEKEVYGFLGQNGAGKSTTIRMLLTLIEPSAGEIKIFGLDLFRHRSHGFVLGPRAPIHRCLRRINHQPHHQSGRPRGLPFAH